MKIFLCAVLLLTVSFVSAEAKVKLEKVEYKSGDKTFLGVVVFYNRMGMKNFFQELAKNKQ